MPAPTPTQLAALRLIIDAIKDTVAAAEPIGAPAGAIYAAMSAQGCSFNQYTSLMGGLVRRGILAHDEDNHVYHLAPVA